MEEQFESTNIHLEWLKNIYHQITTIQDFERIAREGCRDLMEYLQIPINMQRIVMPEAQYKNLRFMALEIDMLISNCSAVLKTKTKEYRDRLSPILKNINRRDIFLRDIKNNNQLMHIEVLSFLTRTIDYLIEIKRDLIQDISPVLFLPEDKKEKGW